MNNNNSVSRSNIRANPITSPDLTQAQSAPQNSAPFFLRHVSASSATPVTVQPAAIPLPQSPQQRVINQLLPTINFRPAQFVNYPTTSSEASRHHASPHYNNLHAAGVQRRNIPTPAQMQSVPKLIPRPPAPAAPKLIPRRPTPAAAAPVPSPKDNFAVEGTTALERFANYLTHPWHSQHVNHLFTTYQKDWPGILCWVFPLPEAPKANRFAPQLDLHIKNYLSQETTARTNQYKTLDTILNHYGIKRTDTQYYLKRDFSRLSSLFNHTNGNPVPLVITRIIRHLASTGRSLHAKNLQQLLITQALLARNEQLASGKQITITDVTLAHWLYSTREDYLTLTTNIQPNQLHQDLLTISRVAPSSSVQQPQQPVQPLTPKPPAPPSMAKLQTQPFVAYGGQNGKTRWNRPLLKVEGAARNVPQYLDITDEEILDEAQRGLSQKTDLNRFISAHRGDEYFGQGKNLLTALNELRAGRKTTHWVWYIFPQIRGLGFSAPNQYYAMHNLQDAQRYLDDPSLKHAFESVIKAAIDSSRRLNRTAHDIFGADRSKVWSSLTLFAIAGNAEAQRGLQHFFSNVEDPNTKRVLAAQRSLSGQVAPQPRVRSHSPQRRGEISGNRNTVGHPPAPPLRAKSIPQQNNGNTPWSMQNKDGFLPIKIPRGAYNYAVGITPIPNTPRQAPPLNPKHPLAHVDIASADIAMAKEQIVVNASNLALTKGGGVDGVIHRKAGASLQTELDVRYKRIGSRVSCYTSEACATHPHGFAANGVHYLIHVTGPDVRPPGVATYSEPYAPAFDGNNWQKDEPKAKHYLQLAYRNVLDKALSLHARSVCLPLLSSGIFQYPADDAAEAALEVCKEDKYKELKIVFYTGKSGSEADKALKRAKQRLDRPARR